MKRRTVAKESAEDGVISLNGKKAKASAEVKVGDTIEVDMWNYYKAVRVLQVPGGGSVAKNALDAYIEVTEYRAK